MILISLGIGSWYYNKIFLHIKNFYDKMEYNFYYMFCQMYIYLTHTLILYITNNNNNLK